MREIIIPQQQNRCQKEREKKKDWVLIKELLKKEKFTLFTFLSYYNRKIVSINR
jgi:hypothetical protein